MTTNHHSDQYKYYPRSHYSFCKNLALPTDTLIVPGGEKYTLKRIGEEMGISPETVRQIEIRALRKLRDQAEEYKEFLFN